MKTKEALLLAGGKSRRMKFDKQEIKIGGQLLVKRTLAKLKAIFPNVTVVTNRPELYKDLGVKTIQDIYPGLGPISGLHTGLVNSNQDQVFMMAVDMPGVEEDYIRWLDNQYSEDLDGILVTQPYIEPMKAIYNKRLLARLEKQITNQEYRLFTTVQRGNFNQLSMEDLERAGFSGEIFTNLNTQEDLKKHDL